MALRASLGKVTLLKIRFAENWGDSQELHTEIENFGIESNDTQVVKRFRKEVDNMRFGILLSALLFSAILFSLRPNYRTKV